MKDKLNTPDRPAKAPINSSFCTLRSLMGTPEYNAAFLLLPMARKSRAITEFRSHQAEMSTTAMAT